MRACRSRLLYARISPLEINLEEDTQCTVVVFQRERLAFGVLVTHTRVRLYGEFAHSHHSSFKSTAGRRAFVERRGRHDHW
jgi:hypothetical protein